jgi:predicted nucleic acid-binding protein
VKVVANATPLIALSLIGELDLLPRIFDEILVPKAVYEEIVVEGAGRPGSEAVSAAPWLQVQASKTTSSLEPLLLGLDSGELQTLLLAQEVQADWVLIDERLGRRVARAMGLEIKGTVGVLLAAFLAGLISKEQALKAVHTLVEKGIRISPSVTAWFEAELDK